MGPAGRGVRHQPRTSDRGGERGLDQEELAIVIAKRRFERAPGRLAAAIRPGAIKLWDLFGSSPAAQPASSRSRADSSPLPTALSMVDRRRWKASSSGEALAGRSTTSPGVAERHGPEGFGQALAMGR